MAMVKKQLQTEGSSPCRGRAGRAGGCAPLGTAAAGDFLPEQLDMESLVHGDALEHRLNLGVLDAAGRLLVGFHRRHLVGEA